ncbi:MAG: S-layer homology domain-containing protein [Syntrophomonas sp.]
MKKTKRSGWLMIAVLLLTTVIITAPAVTSSAAAISDIQGHWAAATIQKMVDQGIVTGMPDGSFQPNNSISRAEFATLVVKAFKLDNKSGHVFNDTSQHWAKDYIAIANTYGIVNGYNDTNFGPDDPITREQMAVMIVKAADLQSNGASLSFSDSAKVSDWAKDAVAVTSTQKVVSGFPDGSFQPQVKATRAQAVVVLSKALASTISVTPVDNSKVYDTAGTYGPADGINTVGGNVTIKTSGVTLQNTLITGDLTIDKAVGEGTVTLKGVTVKGNTYINGGGTNSVYFIDSQTGATYVMKDGGPVHIVVSGTTEISQLIAQSSANIEETDLTGKGFDGIVADRQADGTITVNIAGVNIQSLTVNSTNTNIVTNANTSVGSFVANAAVTVTGAGTISNATINASGVRFAKAPTAQTVATGVSAPTVSTTSTSTSSSSGSGRSTIYVSSIIVTAAADASTVVIGDTLQMSAVVTPTNATNQTMAWSVTTLADGTATINQDGLLTATGFGTVRVTATNSASGVVGIKDITVVAPINNYTALGDSITYGMSATPGHGYVDLFYDNLKSINGNEGIKLLNLGIPGEKSSDLLYKLQHDTTTIDAVSKAKVITISIGGNNLLSPVISAFANAFNLDSTSATFASDLALALANQANVTTFNAVIAGLPPALASGVQQFGTDWVAIIGTIKALAPQAEVYAATLYNPLNQADPLYLAFDSSIQGINTIIKMPNAGYKVADVYTVFRDYQDSDPLTSFSLFTGNLDPHPTTKGHEVIYQAHLDAMEIVAVSAINVLSEGDATSVVNGGTLQMSATVIPTSAVNQTIVWSVAALADGTATIDPATGLLSATGIGTVRVTATNPASGVTGTKDITVTAPPVYASTEALTNATVSVENGTTEADAIAALDPTVEIVGSLGETGTASITWTIAEYNATTAGNYTATGVLTLPIGWTGTPANVTATVTVTS